MAPSRLEDTILILPDHLSASSFKMVPELWGGYPLLKKSHVVNIEQKTKTKKQNKNKFNGKENQISHISFVVTEMHFLTVETRLKTKSWTVVF